METHKEEHNVLRGLPTVTYWATDPSAAMAWSSTLLGIERNFERPGFASSALATTST
jgi:hypothetical protein